jgi:hypothetical protein
VPRVPEGNLRLEKNASAFFGMREGVTFKIREEITA